MPKNQNPQQLLHSKRGLTGVQKIAENRRIRKSQWQTDAKALWNRWRFDPFFVLGIALYWGEGTKSKVDSRLALTNSDARMLKTWLRWCHRFMPGVPLTFSLIVHDTCDADRAKAFWKRELNIDIRIVTVAVSSATKRKRNSLPNGTLKIRVGRGTREWYSKMMVWLEQIQYLYMNSTNDADPFA